MAYSTRYIFGFAAIVCLVCSVFVASSAVGLKERQDENKLLDRRSKVLSVAGIGADVTLKRAEINALYDAHVTPKLVDLKTGAYVEADAKTVGAFDQRKAQKDPKTSIEAPKNGAGIRRLPSQAVVYLVDTDTDKSTDLIVLPVEGKGLWSTLYGFVALRPDLNSLAGLTFYQHGETPGLGGEVDNPTWKAKWPGRKLYDASGKAVIDVIKGTAGPAASAPHKVDGLSGATITGRGVGKLVRFWAGDNGFGPYLKMLSKEGL
ncbi:MAG: Na+-transporting NADH:ubiquinone oxidoreductase subunit C [Myxococcota bacterium]|jgi:Na+-transporting NADH:ubiquinone oxidoreductase subunit C